MTDTTMAGNANSGAELKECPRNQFGTWLRLARESRGLTVESVAQETKISKIYIFGLEAGKFEELPGKIFGRGFVKNITRVLKNDGAEGLRLYDACWETPAASDREFKPLDSVAPFKNSKVNFFKAKSSKPENITFPLSPKNFVANYLPSGKRRRSTSSLGTATFMSSVHMPAWLLRSAVSPQIRMWILGSVAFIFVGLVFGRWAASHIHQSRLASDAAMLTNLKDLPSAKDIAVPVKSPVESENHSQPDMTPTVAVAAKTTATQVDQPGTVVAAESANSNSILSQEDNPLYFESAPGAAFEQVLDVTVLEGVEIRITLDGKKQEKVTFTPDTYKFTFNTAAEVYITDASRVSVSYNGKSAGVLGSKGRKRRLSFQAKATSADFPQ